MAQDERPPADLDRDEPDADEGRGIAGDEEEFEQDEGEDLEDDEEQYDSDERVTGEVGSEGGSPGETVTTRRKTTGTAARGSEATTTWNPEGTESETVDKVGEDGPPRKRNPG